MISDSYRGWAVANTHTHKEAVALLNLDRQGFTAYCPMIAKRVRHARKYQTVSRPLFPGYVFIALGAAQQWRPVLSTFGVRNLIRTGEAPQLLSDTFIASLKAREVDGMLVEPKDVFTAGQQVVMTGGYFDGLTATIIEMNVNDRVAVLLKMLNNEVRAQVPIAQLTALQA